MLIYPAKISSKAMLVTYQQKFTVIGRVHPHAKAAGSDYCSTGC